MTVKYLVSCSKCAYTQEHTDYSLQTIKKFREEWNIHYKGKMRCEHDYQYKLLEENTDEIDRKYRPKFQWPLKHKDYGDKSLK